MYAQNCTFILEGRVVDFHNGEPISNATITLENEKGENIKIQSLNDGGFVAEKVCSGFYSLSVEHEDCEKYQTKIFLDSNRKITIRLEHHWEQLQSVVVHESPIAKTSTGVDKKLSKDILHSSSMTFGEALKEISGVKTLSTGSGIQKLMVDGVWGSRLPHFSGGIRLQDQEWGKEHAPSLSLSQMEQVYVIRGSSTLQLSGEGLGGIIVAKPHSVSSMDSLQGRSSVFYESNGRGLGGNFLVKSRLKNDWGGYVSGEYQIIGDKQAPRYMLTNTGFRQLAISTGVERTNWRRGFSASYSFFQNEIGILRAAHTESSESFYRAVQSAQPWFIADFSYDIKAPFQRIYHHFAKANYFRRFAELGKWESEYGLQYNNRKEFDVRRGRWRDIPSIDLHLFSHQWNNTLTIDKRQDQTIKLGVQTQFQHNFSNPETGIRPLIPDYNRLQIGGFAFLEKKLSEKLSVDAAARYDYHALWSQKYYLISFWNERNYSPEFDRFIRSTISSQYYTEPNLFFQTIAVSNDWSYKFSEQQKLSINLSYLQRPPNVAELFSDGLHQSAAVYEWGDLRLRSEQSLKSVIGYHFRSEGLDVQLDGFYQRANDFIYARPTRLISTIRGAFSVWEYVQTEAELAGLNLNLNYQVLSSLKISQQFNYLYGQDLSMNEPLILVPPLSSITSLRYHSNRFNFGLSAAYTALQSRYPNTNFSINIFENNEFREVEVDISTPPQDYLLWNLDASYSFNFLSRQFEFKAQVFNLFNRRYRDYLNRLRFFADEPGRNIIFQLNFKF